MLSIRSTVKGFERACECCSWPSTYSIVERKVLFSRVVSGVSMPRQARHEYVSHDGTRRTVPMIFADGMSNEIIQIYGRTC